MRREAVIWDDVIYKRCFVCQCGTNLFEDHGTYRKMENMKLVLKCAGCNKNVAYISSVEYPEDGIIEIERRSRKWQTGS